MSRRVGLELTGDRIRAVTIGRWRASPYETFEMSWDPGLPEDAVPVLRKNLGEVSSVALSVGIEFLHLKHVRLPPVSTREKRSILMLEPDRFFPIESGDVVVSVSAASEIVFAADAAATAAWIEAFERWAPVENVEAAPVSLARALAKGGISDGIFRLPTATEEYGIVKLHGGLLASARRVSGETPGEASTRPPEVRGVKPEYMTAFGAVLGAGGAADEMLVSDSAHAKISRRRTASVTRAGFNFALALAFMLAAFDRSRSRLLESAEREMIETASGSVGGQRLQTTLSSMDVELAAAQSVSAAQANPVAVLAAISRRLPAGATVMSVRADGANWQIEGTASDAGALVPALAADSSFEDVRFLSASSRFRDGSRTYETFSIALRALR